MDELQDLLARLRSEPPNRIRALADETGIPYGTLRKLRGGDTANPRYSTLKKLRTHYVERRGQAVAWMPRRRQMGD